MNTSSPAGAGFERARRIADAVLYEGYVLYPYRASARKNRFRWTFGVLAPRAWSAAGGCEPSSMRVECLIECDGAVELEGCLRFLQVERRAVEEAGAEGRFVAVDSLDVEGEQLITWEEGMEREIPFALGLPGAPTGLEAQLAGSHEERLVGSAGRVAGRVVRTQRPLAVTIASRAEPLAGRRLWKLTLTVQNVTPFAEVAAAREEAVASSLVGAHLLLSLKKGAFVSLLDPPPAARAAAAACCNQGAFPVLAGEPGARDLLLASPIVLYDHPQIAPESPGDSFDGTEVDELLALSTRSLTDAEKREARATDARAAAVIDRAEGLSQEALLGLHGRTRTTGISWQPGCRVRIRLGSAAGARRTDAQDMFLQGRVGTVEEVREDFEGRTYLALLLDDDPGAELHRWYGRHLHFSPDEVELLEAARP